eukprot:1158729-Pelagomonas_calceolata.AAC.4
MEITFSQASQDLWFSSLGVAGLKELAVVDSSFEDPTGSQAARGRDRVSGTRKQACVPSRRRGVAGAGAGARQSAGRGVGSAPWRSQTQRKRPQRRRPWTQIEGLHGF